MSSRTAGVSCGRRTWRAAILHVLAGTLFGGNAWADTGLRATAAASPSPAVASVAGPLTCSTVPPGVDRVDVKVLLLYYNPTSGPDFGYRKARQIYPWFPAFDTLIQEYVGDMVDAGGGAFCIDVVERYDLDELPPAAVEQLVAPHDGELLIDNYRWLSTDVYFHNVDHLYDGTWRNAVDLFNNGRSDYITILNDPRFGIPAKIDSGAVNLVWIMTTPLTGFWESAMAGPGAYWVNGSPIPGIPTSRRFVVQAHGVDRTAALFEEVTAHMTENILNHVSWTQSWPKVWQHGAYGPFDDWERYQLTEWQNYGDDVVAPGFAQVGTAHYPPNSPRGSNYAFDFLDIVDSYADDWYNYPNFAGVKKPVNRETWNTFNGDYHRGFEHWWFSHIPRNPGSHGGILNNWWRYIYDVNGPVPAISIGDVTVIEGDAGTTSAVFPVTLSSFSDRTVTVSYTTVDGTATAGSDFTTKSGTLTFPAGTLSQNVGVAVLGDALGEPDETFSVQLSGAVRGTIADGVGVGTIQNDEPRLTIGDTSASEGDSGTSSLTLTVTLAPPSAGPVSVSYGTSPGTALPGTDYATTSATLSFPAGATARTIDVPVYGDTLNEPDETFQVVLAGATGDAHIGKAIGIGTITNDDPLPTLSIGDVTVIEGHAGSTNAVFPVRLSAIGGQTATVSYATAEGSATAGRDFTGTSGMLTFPPGTTSRDVTVVVFGDTAAEPDETFTVRLSGVVNAALPDGEGLGTIVNDEPVRELTHGSDALQTLAADPGPAADSDRYVFTQAPYASYEVLVDGLSPDVLPLELQRLGDDESTVLQTSAPLGVGTSQSLRWRNTSSAAFVGETVRVRSGGCTTDCGADDGYRIRFYETTCSIPRFNNGGSQRTVVVLQNPADSTTTGSVYFWSGAGTLLASSDFTLNGKQTLVLNTSTLAALAGKAGTITIAHDGRYGDLAGKSVALEATSGFSFDSPMSWRPLR